MGPLQGQTSLQGVTSYIGILFVGRDACWISVKLLEPWASVLFSANRTRQWLTTSWITLKTSGWWNCTFGACLGLLDWGGEYPYPLWSSSSRCETFPSASVIEGAVLWWIFCDVGYHVVPSKLAKHHHFLIFPQESRYVLRKELPLHSNSREGFGFLGFGVHPLWIVRCFACMWSSSHLWHSKLKRSAGGRTNILWVFPRNLSWQ